jgi:hypothetical protein
MLLLALHAGFTIRPKAGPRRAAWYPRSSGQRELFPRVGLRSMPKYLAFIAGEVQTRASATGKLECRSL